MQQYTLRISKDSNLNHIDVIVRKVTRKRAFCQVGVNRLAEK